MACRSPEGRRLALLAGLFVATAAGAAAQSPSPYVALGTNSGLSPRDEAIVQDAVTTHLLRLGAAVAPAGETPAQALAVLARTGRIGRRVAWVATVAGGVCSLVVSVEEYPSGTVVETVTLRSTCVAGTEASIFASLATSRAVDTALARTP